jgi:hypothetical protein
LTSNPDGSENLLFCHTELVEVSFYKNKKLKRTAGITFKKIRLRLVTKKTTN